MQFYLGAFLRRVSRYAQKVRKMPAKLDLLLDDSRVAWVDHSRSLEEINAEHSRLSERLNQVEAHLAGLISGTRISLSTAPPPVPRDRRARVLFLVHHIESWAAIEPIYLRMLHEGDFEPLVASIPRRFPGSSDFGDEEYVHDELEKRGIEHYRFRFTSSYESLAIIKKLAPDITFRQSQWDLDIGGAFSPDMLGFTRLTMMSYGTMTILEGITSPPDFVKSAFDSPLHRLEWMGFVTNDYMMDLMRRENTLKAKQFRVVGHPKYDHFLEVDPAWPVETDMSRPKLVWSAHHAIGDDWSRFGLFPQTKGLMLEQVANHPEIDFLFMAHPALLTFVNSPSSPLTQEEFGEFLDRWGSCDNACTYVGADYAPYLAASDAMVTDGISMLIEYQVLEKPLVYLEREGHRPFNLIGEKLRQGMHSFQDVGGGISQAISFALGEADAKAAAQRAVVKELFPVENAAARVVEALREGLEKERALADSHHRTE